MHDRRVFLKSSGLTLLAYGFLPKVFVRMADGAPGGGARTLVVVFQRGAVDGLNMVIPCGERVYYEARPGIAVPRPGSSGGAIDLDGFFALHPALAPLHPLYRDGSLAAIHAAGSPDPSRSHFDAQDFMESGTPGVKSTPDGFLSRALVSRPRVVASPLRAVAISPVVPRILSGGAGALAASRLSDFSVSEATAARGFEQMYSRAPDRTFGAAARESSEASRILKAAAPQKLTPANGAEYPPGPLGNALKQIAGLIRSEVGLEIGFAEAGGWDTHAGQGGSEGRLANRLGELARSLSAFHRDLGSRMTDVTLVTCSEFGRTVRENGNRGTDHGHANAMFVLGGGVRGGRVGGEWPGLDASHLYENRDLAVTTDFRDVFGEILVKRLGVEDLGRVFPGYASDRKRWQGLIA